MVAILIELGDDPGQADDLRPRPDNRHHLQTRHLAPLLRTRRLRPRRSADHSSPFGVSPASSLRMKRELEQSRLHLLDVEAFGIVRVVVLELRDPRLALLHELAVVEVAQIRRNPEVSSEVLRRRSFLPAQQGLELLLAVARSDDLDPVVGLAEDLQQRVRDGPQRGRRRLLDEDVAGVAVVERERDQLNRLLERHHEARHGRIGDRDRLAAADLLGEQRDDRAARGHHVAVARAADHGSRRIDVARLGDHDLLHHGLGDAHGVDRIDRLIGAQAHDAAHAVHDGGLEHVLRPVDVGLDRFHRVEFARGHLLERRRMKDVVDPARGVEHAGVVAHVADVVFELVAAIELALVVLLLLVAAENPDLADVRIEERAQDGVAE